jgi:hypothetical protein
VPEAYDDYSRAGGIDSIPDDIGAASKGNDELAVRQPCCRATALRHRLERESGIEQPVIDPAGQCLAVWFEKITEPEKIGACALEKDDLHLLSFLRQRLWRR